MQQLLTAAFARQNGTTVAKNCELVAAAMSELVTTTRLQCHFFPTPLQFPVDRRLNLPDKGR